MGLLLADIFRSYYIIKVKNFWLLSTPHLKSQIVDELIMAIDGPDLSATQPHMPFESLAQ